MGQQNERNGYDVKQIIAKLERFLKEENYKINNENDQRVYYKIAARDQRNTIIIYIPDESLDRICAQIEFGFKVKEQELPDFSPIDEDTDEIAIRISEALNSYFITYENEVEATDIGEIKISKVMYFDGFSKNVLMDTLNYLIFTHSNIESLYRKLIKEYQK